MKKALVFIVLSITLLLCLTACHSHSYGEWTTTKAPSCSQDGEQVRYCSCGEIQTRPIMATDHKWTEATCDAPKTCTICGKTDGSPCEHDFGFWLVIEPTGCMDGTRSRGCYNCNFEEYYVIETSGHQWKDATCTSPKTCSVCGRIDGEAKGHNFGEWVISKNVTETEEGLKERTCDCGEKEAVCIPIRDGEYIYFGEYPQTIKADDVTITETQDYRGYYLGSDGCYYAQVTANPYYWEHYAFSTGETIISGIVYYFKVEPIRWRILSEENGEAFILCDSIIESHRFDDNLNNYAESEIRAWLNSTFYEIAFTSLQQAIILTTEVDNSVASTGYESNPLACKNTHDKVFLLSYAEATNSAYGFSTDKNKWDSARRMLISDYLRATGEYMDTSSSYYGNGCWWLRSPLNGVSNYHCSVYCAGDVGNFNVDGENGVVPALRITL